MLSMTSDGRNEEGGVEKGEKGEGREEREKNKKKGARKRIER